VHGKNIFRHGLRPWLIFDFYGSELEQFIHENFNGLYTKQMIYDAFLWPLFKK